MKDIPVFTTEHGAASLFLREIPYRKRAHIKLQATQEPEKLLEECISFCRACGAEWIDAAGNDCLERYPLITAIVAMQCEKAAIPETDVCLFPVTENTVSKWLDIYNERMADVPNAAFMDSADGRELLKSGDERSTQAVTDLKSSLSGEEKTVILDGNSELAKILMGN